MKNVLPLSSVVGSGYNKFWHYKGRYRVCKGSRASKKSTTTALNIIKRMMEYPDANTLVVRKVFRTLKDSCFTQDLITQGAGNYQQEEITVIFNRDILINESEAISNCQNSVGILSTETIVEQHPWTKDAQTELERLKREKEEAMADYQGAFPNH